MKVSDYVIDFLARQGIKHNFLVSGGAVVHLVDSVARHPTMKYICNQHEQHCAAAADMYARVSRNLGVVMTTSGPGATNIVTSVCNAFFDSVPLLCITGQVSRFRLKKSKKLRQRGFQETDVISIFQSITKYAKQVLDPLDIRYELEKAVYLAKEGRPGPVLLDIPDDLQRENIDPANLRGFSIPPSNKKNSEECFEQLFSLISQAKRPIIIFGAGIKTAVSNDEALEFAEYFNIPVVTTWGGADIIFHDHELNMGHLGVYGPRGGNFAVQTADLIIAMGTRLSQMITGGKPNLFAVQAKKVMIDVDAEELDKFDASTFIVDLPIQMDLKDFFSSCKKTRPHFEKERTSAWKQLIQTWRKKYPISPSVSMDSRVQPHYFIKQLSALAQEGDIIIGDTGANLSWTMQTFENKKRQRIFSAWNHTPMGYSLPASIGAALASNQEIICLIGDGGLMMCLQELATIRRNNLPIRIFIFDNQGHGIQKQTIDTWLNSNYAGVNVPTGLYFPHYQKIAESFDLPFVELQTNKDLDLLPKIWRQKGPWICNVQIIEDEKIYPMLKFGAGLEDLDPKLPPEEIQAIFQESQMIEDIKIETRSG